MFIRAIFRRDMRPHAHVHAHARPPTHTYARRLSTPAAINVEQAGMWGGGGRRECVLPEALDAQGSIGFARNA